MQIRHRRTIIEADYFTIEFSVLYDYGSVTLLNLFFSNIEFFKMRKLKTLRPSLTCTHKCGGKMGAHGGSVRPSADTGCLKSSR